MARKCCSKSCKLLLQLCSGTFVCNFFGARWYGTKKVLCTGLAECGGVIFFFLTTRGEKKRHAPHAFRCVHIIPRKPRLERAGEGSCNLFSPHSRYPKASNLVPQRCCVELAPSGWHCCCCGLRLRNVIRG